MTQLGESEERSATEYLGVARASTARHPTDHPFRKAPSPLGQPRPSGNLLIIVTVLLLPVWSYFLLRHDPLPRVLRLQAGPVLCDDFGGTLKKGMFPSIRRPGNVLVLVEAIMGIRMAWPFIFRFTNAQMTPFLALVGWVFHLVVGAIGCTLFRYRVRNGRQSGTESEWEHYLALGLVGASCVAETVMESRRHAWKADPKNKGKIYSQSGFGACRHPNFTCFILYRCFGIALASGSLYFHLGLLAFQLFYFIRTVVPEIEGYMDWKYGETWKAYCGDVPYKLIPNIY